MNKQRKCSNCIHFDTELFRVMEIGFCNVFNDLSDKERALFSELDRNTHRDCALFVDNADLFKSRVKRERFQRGGSIDM